MKLWAITPTLSRICAKLVTFSHILAGQRLKMCASGVQVGVSVAILSDPCNIISGMDDSVPNLVGPDTLARRIRMEMGAQKVSRKRLSETTGISRRALARKLDGEVPFTYEEFSGVVAALHLDWSLLLSAKSTAETAFRRDNGTPDAL